jgi:hypothetical protein
MTFHGGKDEQIVVDSWPTTGGDRVEIFRNAIGCDNPGCDLAHYAGDYYWRVRAGNGEIVGQGEGHPRKANAVAAARRHHPPVD